MARIIGGIAASHTPTIGFAYDRNKRDDPVWAPIFANFAPLAAWLAEKKPDVLLLIYNDHVTSFFFDHYSAFALGVGPEWQVADEGAGPRDLPPIQGHPELAAHIGQSLVADEFDMSFFQHRALDHGCFSPLSVLCPHEPAWPAKLIPLQMGVLQLPMPSARRFYKLGQALRRAIESYPEDLRVAVVATGGLSHQVHGERAGFNNTPWDQRFLDLFERDPERLASMTIAEFATLGGFEGAEVVMWLTMRGALPAQVECKGRSYYLPSMAGIATAIYEVADEAPDAAIAERQRRHIGAQLDGVEKLAGTYPFTLQRATARFRINDYLHRMVERGHREAFLRDPEASFEAAGLTAEERDLIRRRDWRGMMHYGVIFFMLEKLGAVTGVSNLHIYAAMRGETLEQFQKTRNAPGALYSVAGKEGGKLAWDAPTPIRSQHPTPTGGNP
jgi:gallate dioxygenase